MRQSCKPFFLRPMLYWLFFIFSCRLVPWLWALNRHLRPYEALSGLKVRVLDCLCSRNDPSLSPANFAPPWSAFSQRRATLGHVTRGVTLSQAVQPPVPPIMTATNEITFGFPPNSFHDFGLAQNGSNGFAGSFFDVTHLLGPSREPFIPDST